MTSGFRREVATNCALLGYYAANSGNFLPTFRDNQRSHPQGSRPVCLCNTDVVCLLRGSSNPIIKYQMNVTLQKLAVTRMMASHRHRPAVAAQLVTNAAVERETIHPHYLQSDVCSTRLLSANTSINNPSEPLLTSVHHSTQLFTALIVTDIHLSVGTGGQPAL